VNTWALFVVTATLGVPLNARETLTGAELSGSTAVPLTVMVPAGFWTRLVIFVIGLKFSAMFWQATLRLLPGVPAALPALKQT